MPVAARQALAKRLPPEQLDLMVQEYLSGEGCTVLSRRYGTSENGVIAHLKRRGVPIRPRGKLSTADRDEIRRLRDAGWSLQSIADQFAVTRSAVSRHLTRDGHEDDVRNRTRD